MTAFPKDPPIIDRELMRRILWAVQRCEWPGNPCHARVTLQVCHIRARGMGGGRRKDTIDNLVILCREHHNHYDNRMGQSRKNQQWMRLALDRRAPDVWKAILG